MKASFFKKENLKVIILDALAVIVGSFCYAVAINVFIEPLGINVGGATGIATILNRLIGTPIGLMIIIINIPLVLLAWKVLGFKFIVRSAVGLTAISIAIDVLPSFETGITDVLLCSLFGGAAMGLSLGILFARGYTTGGSDFAVWMLRKKFPQLSTGVIYLLVDAAVIISAALVQGTPQQLMYSVVTIFVSQKVLDLILSLGESAELVYVISEKHNEIAECIAKSVGRGVTVLDGYGYYSGRDKKVLLCAMSKNQFYPFLSKVKSIDENAFVITANAGRVIGEGFKRIE